MKEKQNKRKREKGLASMKTKLVGVILPVIIAILAVLVIFSYTISSKIIAKRCSELLSSSVNFQSTSIEGWLNQNLASFKMTKQSLEKTKPEDEDLQRVLDTTAGYNSNFPEGVYIGDTTGKMWKAADCKKSASGMTESTWFKEGLTRVSMRYGTAYQNDAGENIVSASAILNDNAEHVRVISADVSLQRITTIVNSFVEMKDAEAFLVDASNMTMLANRDASLISTKLEESSSDKLLAAVAGKIASMEYDQCTLEGNLVAFDEIAGTNWVLVSFIPRDIIFADVNALRLKMIIISVIAVLLLVVIIERCVHIIIRPVKGLTKNIVAMSDGDFTIDVQAKGADEIGRMSRSVADFIVSIKGMLQDIQDISGQVEQHSESTNTVSDNMYHVAEVQAQSMKELNVTVDQLSESIGEIADSATQLAMVVSDTKATSVQVESYMTKTVEISEKGKLDMQRVSEAMENISQSIQKLDVAISKVGKASEEITNIVSVIGSIADETNLLSLNASIEAARAGEAGKGFAVVASEIGKLASTSTESVDDIVALVGEITNLVQETVDQAQSSMDNIHESSGLINTALNTFDSIFADIHSTSDMIDEMMVKVGEVDEVATNVAAISEEQAASTEEIHATSEDMAEQAKNIAESSKNVLTGAQELSQEANQLTEHLKKFKI